MPPDSEETFIRNTLTSSVTAAHKTYGSDDIMYHYNSRGFRRPEIGPADYEDVGDYANILVGGCSITEGIGMPEKHLWHSFLVNSLTKDYSKLIAKFNVGKGARSIDATIRYVYTAIQHDGCKPDIVYLLLPPVARQELILLDDQNTWFIWHFLGGVLPSPATSSMKIAYETLTRSTNYMQLYHNCFRNLILLKWFLSCKQIPWFFSFWNNDLMPAEVTKSLDESNTPAEYNIPEELRDHFVDTYSYSYDQTPAPTFEYTIARDYAHCGPNFHYNLADSIHQTLKNKPAFVQLIEKWRNNERT
jgi:hypothetical protein